MPKEESQNATAKGSFITMGGKPHLRSVDRIWPSVWPGWSDRYFRALVKDLGLGWEWCRVRFGVKSWVGIGFRFGLGLGLGQTIS